jgi:hypothetical protein
MILSENGKRISDFLNSINVDLFLGHTFASDYKEGALFSGIAYKATYLYQTFRINYENVIVLKENPFFYCPICKEKVNLKVEIDERLPISFNDPDHSLREHLRRRYIRRNSIFWIIISLFASLPVGGIIGASFGLSGQQLKENLFWFCLLTMVIISLISIICIFLIVHNSNAIILTPLPKDQQDENSERKIYILTGLEIIDDDRHYISNPQESIDKGYFQATKKSYDYKELHELLFKDNPLNKAFIKEKKLRFRSLV